MRLVYVLYGFGVLLCVSAVAYLAAEYIRFISEAGVLAVLLLVIAMFTSLGKYFESLGW